MFVAFRRVIRHGHLFRWETGMDALDFHAVTSTRLATKIVQNCNIPQRNKSGRFNNYDIFTITVKFFGYRPPRMS